jgi:DNA-binding IclR family transcriptional regulator
MAFLPDEEVVELLDAASDEGDDVDLISHQLDVVRASGYLACIGDFVPGVGSISVPVFSSSGIAGALTVSGPADRFTLEAIEAVAPDVVHECAMLSMALGHIREAGQ